MKFLEASQNVLWTFTKIMGTSRNNLETFGKVLETSINDRGPSGKNMITFEIQNKSLELVEGTFGDVLRALILCAFR